MGVTSYGSLETGNLKEKAYRIIKDKIADCEYAPGEILNEESLKIEIQASRTPIREALNRLEQEKLIKIVAKKGVFVADITLKNIIDIFQVRELVDPYITAIATPLISEERLLYYKDAHLNSNINDYRSYIKLDSEFHNLIARACNNSYLMQLSENIYVQNQRVRILSTMLPKRIEESRDEHIDIISCMLERNPQKAAESMSRHLAKSKDTAFKISSMRP